MLSTRCHCWGRKPNKPYEDRDMKEAIVAFFKEEDGLTAVEYAIAGALVVGGAVVAFDNLGTSVNTRIECLNDAVMGTAPAGC
jgi:pilus assembly protein Flp/PilA